MASIGDGDTRTRYLETHVVDLRKKPQQRLQDPNEVRLLKYHDSLSTITTSSPSYSLLLTSHTTSQNPFFANACIHDPSFDQLYLTSSPLPSTSSSQPPQVLISRVSLARNYATTKTVTAVEWRKIHPPTSMPNPGSACAYEDGIVYCSQGNLDPETGGLFYMYIRQSKPPTRILTHYGGKSFNSLQRVALSPVDGSLWFTDSDVGADSRIRPEAKMPNLVYRYAPQEGITRVMADGLGRPCAIAFSADGETVYISDVEAGKHEAEDARIRPSTIYAYDITIRHEQPFLTNKRVFAVPFDGVATALLSDPMGNVYATCGDGVEIWSPGGVPLGLVEIAGGCSSLCFGRNEELFIGAGQRLWRLRF
ncbi:putative SMP-30/Gluconolactonase/LRE-like region domain-containing protein [Seiridium cardinale]|uniref:SMP-30/Gluconolactonase/LRE-like region domain-containing protein n=1 Tax=Seiridium cardinale TaxID=138064 RepID=A0ABR2XBS5_9PEZI